jgi:hypothetical protein
VLLDEVDARGRTVHLIGRGKADVDRSGLPAAGSGGRVMSAVSLTVPR